MKGPAPLRIGPSRARLLFAPLRRRARSGGGRGLPDALLARVAWPLLLAVLLGAACAPLGAEARGDRECHGGEVSGEAARTAHEAPPTTPAPPDRASGAHCVRHCRSAGHGLQSLAPRPEPAGDSGPLFLASLPAAAADPGRGPAHPASARTGPIPAPPCSRPILHCALLL